MANDSTNSAFASALASERKDRAVAMLGLPELINGVEVKALTRRILEWLTIAGNPFIVGGEIKPEALLQFVWHVSPSFKPFATSEERQVFIAPFFAMDKDELREGIEKYLDRAFLDAPTGEAGTQYYSATAGLYHALNTCYPNAGWTLDTVLDLPLRIGFQLIKAADKAAGCMVLNRRSSPLISQYLSEIENFKVANADEVEPFIEQKRAEGYGLCSEPCQCRDGTFIVAMRKLAN